MRNDLFSGVCTAMITPFLGGQVNYPMLEVLLQRQMDAGISTVVICGTTGEAPTLSDHEKIELFRRSKAYVGSRMKVIAGTGSNSTEHAVDLSRAAQDVGLDGLLVVSPYYNKATADGLVTHYASIAHRVNIPLIVYNVPSRTGQDMPVSVYKRLSAIPNIIGVKEASSSIQKVLKIRTECPDFAVWTGNDDMTVPVMSLGGLGVISVASNALPAEMNTMVKCAEAGDFTAAAAIQYHLTPLMEALFSEVNPIPIKAAMKLLGYDCGSCRLPLTAMSQDNTEKLATILKNI